MCALKTPPLLRLAISGHLDELLVICSYLSGSDLCALSCVSKRQPWVHDPPPPPNLPPYPPLTPNRPPHRPLTPPLPPLSNPPSLTSPL